MIISIGRQKFKRILESKKHVSALNKKRLYSTEGVAAKIHKYGDPYNVLKLEKFSIPSINDKQVLVEMIYAPINPMDISSIEGNTPTNYSFPSPVGSDGVGKIVQVGKNIKDLKVGDYVIPSRSDFGTWRTHAIADPSDLIQIDRKGLKCEYLACLPNLSTAYRLLEDFVKLKEGDVIIQSGANSMVGLSIVQLARLKGVKTINFIRNGPLYDDNVEHIKAYGGHIVDSYQYLNGPSFKRLISDLPKPKLLINNVGSDLVHGMSKLLDHGSTVVTYGAMSNQPITVPASSFIFKNLTMRGFWLERWNKEHSLEERKAMYDHILSLCENKSLKIWTEAHQFEKGLDTALQRSREYGRARKVVLSLNDNGE